MKNQQKGFNGIHPLLIDHILEKILIYHGSGNSSSLLQTRRVCRQWNLASARAYRTLSKDLISFGKTFHPIKTLPDFFKVIGKSISFPITSFRLCQDAFQPSHESLLRDFFKKCSPLLSTVILRLDQESTIRVPKNFLDQISLPWLKTLIYDDRKVLSDAFDKNLLLALLGACSNLETLSLHQQGESFTFGNPDAREEFNTRVCEILKEIGKVPKLTNLQLGLELDDRMLECLSSNLKPDSLTCFTVCFRRSTFHKNSLYDLLKSQRDSLEELKLGGICKRSSFEIKFPTLSRLQSLEIHGWDAIIPGVKFSRFTYAEHFPSLRTLILNTWLDEPSWNQFFKCSSETVEMVKLPQELRHPELIQDIKYSFTNLRSLEIHYVAQNVDVLENVFKTLVNLEELKINQYFGYLQPFKNIDSLLTGLTSTECKRLAKVSKYRQLTQSDYRILNNSALPRVGLSNFKSLKVLDIRDLLKFQACVSDVSGYFFDSSIKTLESLKIRRSQMTHKCLTELSIKFPTDLEEEMELSAKQNEDPVVHSCCIS